MSAEIECKLVILQRDWVRMDLGCERPRVKLGYEKCKHFIGNPLQTILDAEDVVEVCRRAKEARELPSIDKRISKSRQFSKATPRRS